MNSPWANSSRSEELMCMVGVGRWIGGIVEKETVRAGMVYY